MLKEVFPNLMMVTDLGELLDQIAIQLPWDYKSRQQILECVLLEERYETVMGNLLTEIEITRVKREIQGRVKENVDKNQKDYILREQLKVIREELGEDNPLSDADEYEKQLKALKADKETKDKIHREIERFKAMPGGARKPMYSDVSGDGAGSSVEKNVEGQQQYDSCRRDPKRGSLRSGKGEGEDSGISGCPHSDEEGDKPDYLSGGTSGNR